MIRFRQKEFIAPLLGGILTKEVAGNLLVNGGAQAIGTAGQLGAARTAAKQQEESDRTQERIARQQNIQAAKDRQAQQKQAQDQLAFQKQQLKAANNQYNKQLKLARKTGISVTPNITATQPQQQQFSRVTEGAGFVKNLGTLAKERGLHKAMAGALIGGAISGGGAYLIDKAIQKDIEKDGKFKVAAPELTAEEKKEAKKKRNRKIAGSVLTGAALVGTGVAAKKGKLGTKTKEIANKYISRDTIKKAGNTLKEAGRDHFTHLDEETGKRKLNKLNLAITGVSLATPAVMYKMKKKQYEDQVKQSEGDEERTYSKKPQGIRLDKLGKQIKSAFKSSDGKKKSYNGTVLDIPVKSRSFRGQLNHAVKKTKTTLKNVGSKISEGWGEFKKHPAESTLGAASSYFEGGGRKGVARFGEDLEELGKKSRNKTSQKVGKFIQDNPKTALAGSIVVGGVAIRKARNKVWNTTSKTIEKVDPNAFAYAKYGAQVVPQDRKEEEKENE